MTQSAPEHKEPTPAAPSAVVDTGRPGSTEPAAPLPRPPAAPGTPGKPHKTVKIEAAELDLLRRKAAEADNYYDQLLRARAEFDNYRKRIAQEKQYAELAANEKILHKLISLLDTFDLAIASGEQSNAHAALLEGVKLLRNQLHAILKEAGLEEIDAVGAKFDPHLHEAIQQQESDAHEEGTILHQTRKGYRFKDRLLRAASVVVSKKSEPPPPA